MLENESNRIQFLMPTFPGLSALTKLAHKSAQIHKEIAFIFQIQLHFAAVEVQLFDFQKTTATYTQITPRITTISSPNST